MANIILRADTGESIEMDYWRYGFVISDIEIDGINAEQKVYAGLHQVGQRVIDSTLTTRGVTLTGWIRAVSTDDMRDKKQRLSRICSPLHSFDLIRRDLSLTITPRSSVKFDDPDGEHIAHWMIDGLAYDPCWHPLNAAVTEYARYLPNLHYPNSYFDGGMAYSVANDIESLRIVNDGDLPCGLVAEIDILMPISSFTLTNASTGEMIVITYAFNDGDKLFIDTRYGKKGVSMTRGDATTDITGYISYDSAFPQLALGDNIIEYTVGGDNADEDSVVLVIRHLPMYLGG